MLLVIALLASAAGAWAQGTAEAIPDYTASVVGPVNSTAGWTFEATANLTATELGCFTNVFAKNTDVTTVQVGLWAPDGSLLASSTVTPASTLVNESLYEAITPVVLSPGLVYHIGVFFPPDGNLSLDAALSGSYSNSPDISVRGTALAGPGAGFVSPVEMTPLDGAIYAGPNFQFQEGGVPEPASGLLLGFGALLLIVRRVTRRP